MTRSGLESATVNPAPLLSLNHRSLLPVPEKPHQVAIPSKSDLNRFRVIGRRPDGEIQENSSSSLSGRQLEVLDPVNGLSTTGCCRVLPRIPDALRARSPFPDGGTLPAHAVTRDRRLTPAPRAE